jgi:hypothetical protein
MHKFLFFLLATFLIIYLEASVFKVDVRHPSDTQKQTLAKWRQRIRHTGFAGRPKGTMLSKNQLKAKALLGAKGGQNNEESSEIDDLDVNYDPYFYRVWLNPQGTIKLGIPRESN